MPVLTRRTFCAAAAGLAVRGPARARAAREDLPTQMSALGVQAGILRPLLSSDFEGTLARVAALGYDAVELQWYVRGGADPLAYLRTHGPRYRLGHLKDVTVDNSVGGRFGEGRVPMAEVIAALSKRTAHQFIEHPLRSGHELDDLGRIRQLVEGRRP